MARAPRARSAPVSAGPAPAEKTAPSAAAIRSARALLGEVRRWLEPALGALAGDGDPAARALAAVGALVAAPGVAGWVDPEPMAALLVAVANGLVVQATVDPDGPDVGAMAEQFVGLPLSARTTP